MPDIYQQRFGEAKAIIEHHGKPIGKPLTVREPGGNLRQTNSVHRLRLGSKMRESLNELHVAAGLGRIAYMRAALFLTEEDIESTITIGCKHESAILSTKKHIVLLEREYMLTSDPTDNLIVDVMSGPTRPDEPDAGTQQRPAMDTDAAFINSMLVGIARYYPRT